MIVHGCSRLCIKIADLQQIGAFVLLNQGYVRKESGGNVRKSIKKRGNRSSSSINMVIMTCDEVAAYLRVHVSSVRRWSRSGKITAYKVGGRGDWRYREQDVLSFLYDTNQEGEGQGEVMVMCMD